MSRVSSQHGLRGLSHHAGIHTVQTATETLPKLLRSTLSRATKWLKQFASLLQAKLAALFNAYHPFV
ncbi:MAG: hypothetical protein VKJ06_08710 [Vampirovibrionales bacterium]|nr:hypothetical protein [Vampirovibrionales bacterium]